MNAQLAAQLANLNARIAQKDSLMDEAVRESMVSS